MKLSPHFTLAEAMKSQTASRRGIDNKPPKEAVEALKATAEAVLEPIRDHFGIPFTPSSWYRSPALNRAIGGSSTSQHCKGEAVDIEVPGIDNLTLAHWIKDNLLFDQLILECYKYGDPTSGWVHVSFVSQLENRGQVLTYSGGHYNNGLPSKEG